MVEVAVAQAEKSAALMRQVDQEQTDRATLAVADQARAPVTAVEGVAARARLVRTDWELDRDLAEMEWHGKARLMRAVAAVVARMMVGVQEPQEERAVAVLVELVGLDHQMRMELLAR